MLIPGYPTHELERRLHALGFTTSCARRDGERARRSATSCASPSTSRRASPTGPGATRRSWSSDGTARLVNQNDCRTDDLDALRAHGPVDLHWLQYSGAIWYPMVYDEPPERMRELVDAKVDSQFARAMRYVEAIDAAAVVPSAGPPAFLDPELFRLQRDHRRRAEHLPRPAHVPRPAGRSRATRRPGDPGHRRSTSTDGDA